MFKDCRRGFRLRSKELEDRTAESSSRAADLQDGWESSKEAVGSMQDWILTRLLRSFVG